MRAGIVGFAAGIVWLQQQATLPEAGILALLGFFAFLLSGLSFWTRLHLPLSTLKMPLRPMLRLVLGVLFGILWSTLFALYYLNQGLPKELENRDLTLTGTIASLPYQFERGVRFHFNIEQAKEKNAEQGTLSSGVNSGLESGLITDIPQKVTLAWYSSYGSQETLPVPDIQPGQRWTLNVRLKRPHSNANPYGFDYEVWMLEQNLQATGYVRYDKKNPDQNSLLTPFVFSASNLINLTRSQLRERIQSALPEHPYTGVIVALVIGDQRAISQSDWTIFNRTGISHLVSISGLHITMVSGMFAAFFAGLWRRSFFTNQLLPLRLLSLRPLPLILPTQKAAAIAGVFMALLYVLLAGFGIPAQRTLYMLIVVAFALWTGKITHISHILLAALGIVLLIDPWAVLAPGFWLSFSAVGLILYTTVGRVETEGAARTRKERWYRILRSAIRVQIAITLGLVPLTMLLFGQLSLVSPFANAISIPLVSFIVTPLALIGSIAPSFLSPAILGTAHFFINILANGLEWFSALPLAVWEVPIPCNVLFFIALVGTIWMLAPRGWPARWAGIFCWLPLILQVPSHPQEGETWITAFDVGQGSALLIETREHRLLFDTGPSYAPEVDGGNRVILPYLKSRQITSLDKMIVSHADNDHAGGAISILKAIPITHLLSSLHSDDPISQAAKSISTHEPCLAAQNWVWDGIQFEILHPDKALYLNPPKKGASNALSCVLKVTAGNQSILLTGDIGTKQEMELVARIPEKLKTTILVAPHHGSRTSSSQDFLDVVQPDIALFQMGYLNRYKHPADEIVERYRMIGAQRFRTDETGAISIRMNSKNGDKIEIEPYRSTHARYWYKK